MPLLNVFKGVVTEAIYSQDFEKKYVRLKDRILQKRIEQVVGRICQLPNHRDARLLVNRDGQDLRGKRHRHIDGDHEIIYAWCYECKQNGFHRQGLNGCCLDPEQSPDNRVIFLEFGTHKELFGKETN